MVSLATALTLLLCPWQCPVSLRRTCEPFLWRPTRLWSLGQSLHGWHCTVCLKATGLCSGPSSPMEVGAVGARPSGQCRVIITYLILNSNNQPAQHTPTPTYPPASLSVLWVDKCQCCILTCFMMHFLFLRLFLVFVFVVVYLCLMRVVDCNEIVQCSSWRFYIFLNNAKKMSRYA